MLNGELGASSSNAHSDSDPVEDSDDEDLPSWVVRASMQFAGLSSRTDEVADRQKRKLEQEAEDAEFARQLQAEEDAVLQSHVSPEPEPAPAPVLRQRQLGLGRGGRVVMDLTEDEPIALAPCDLVPFFEEAFKTLQVQ